MRPLDGEMQKHILVVNGNDTLRQVLCSTVGADERTNASMSAPQLAWLADTQLMPQLLEKLGQDSGTDALRNAASVLVAIARAPLAAPLARSFLAPDFLQKLLDSAFVPTVSVQVGPQISPATLSARDGLRLNMASAQSAGSN